MTTTELAPLQNELYTSYEADLTLKEIEGRLRTVMDLDGVADALWAHQPGDKVRMADFELPSSNVGTDEYGQPNFYQRYVSDKLGAVSRTPLQAIRLDEEKYPVAGLLLEKREDRQDFVRAFKVRGAMMVALETFRTKPEAHVFTTGSAGNHALGLLQAVNVLNRSLVARGQVRTDEAGEVVEEDRHLLYQAHIYCSETISQTKYDRLTGNGATVFMRDSLEQALDDAENAADGATAVFVHPYDNETVMAGQATIGLELLFDLKDQGVDLQNDDIELRVPIGGGGLYAGLAAVWQWAKQEGLLRPDAKLIAVEMDGCDSAAREISGRTPLGAALDTDAEGLATQAAGRNTLPVIRHYSHQGVEVVPKQYVVMAAAELAKLHPDETPELAAVVSLAATLHEADAPMPGKNNGRPVKVTLTTGSNIAPEMLTKNSRDYSEHQDGRVAAAATELGHRAMRLAFRLVSQAHVDMAARLEAIDPSIVMAPPSSRSSQRIVRQTKRNTGTRAVQYALRGATLRQYVPSPYSGL